MFSIAQFLILIAALISWVPVSTQNGDDGSPTPLVLTDGQDEYVLGQHMEILEDPSGKLTIQDVSSSAYAQHFIPSRTDTPNFGYSDSTYWVRFQLRNASLSNDDWLLEVDFPNMQYVDLYLPSPEGNGYLIKQSGVMRPFNTREIASHHILFNLPLAPNKERTYYMRFQSGASMTLAMTLWVPGAFFREEGSELLFLGVFYGILLIMLAYNLFLLYTLREASYLYYVCFLVSGILLFASYDTLASQFLWPGLPAFNRFAVPLFFTLFMASITEFTDTFLETRTRNPRLHRLFMILMAGWGIFLLLVPFVSYRIYLISGSFFGILSFGIVGVAAIISWRARYRPARYFFFSWLGLIIGGSVVLLVRLDLLPSTILTEQSFRLGIIWLVAFWAVALADRISLLRAEKEKANLAVQASEAQYHQLVDTMNDGLAVMDKEGRVTYANERLVEMLGYPEEEIIGKPAFEFADEENRQILVKEFTARKAGLSAPYEITWRRKDGSELFTLVSPKPLFEDGGQYKGSFAVVTDISERVQASRLLEQRVAERTRELSTLLEISHVISASQELEVILNMILERLKIVVDYLGAVILVQQEDHWIHLAQNWLSLSEEPGDLELSAAEVQALVNEFDHGAPILIRNINLDETIQANFKALAMKLSPSVACWLGVPLFEKGLMVGSLILAQEQADAYSEDQVKIAVAFANQIGIAIENNHLYQQVRESTVLEERNRLARELHDSVTQVLFSASLVAEVLPMRIRRDPQSALQSAAELRRLTRGALAEMRTMLLELRPAVITRTPLGELLSQLTEAVTSRSELRFQLYIENLPRLPADVQIVFYRIAQESLNNVVKHARAGLVTVSMGAVPSLASRPAEGWQGEIRLVIRDDGIGYNPEDPKIAQGHMGLGIMQERAAAIDASLRMESQPGQGTAVTLIWHN